MSLSNFHRMFLAIVGYSVKEYIRLRRISCAANDLIHSNLRIIDIAVKYSYTSADSFSRTFKMITGFLPSEYKKHKHCFHFRRINIMERYFEVQDKELMEQYPDIKVLKNLEPVKVAYYCYVGKNPEDHAFEVLSQWMNKSGFNKEEQNYRIFGYNNPSPSTPEQLEYGYEVCMTIPEDMVVEDENVKTKTLEGGLYAVISVKRDKDSEIGYERVKNKFFTLAFVISPLQASEITALNYEGLA